MQNAHQRLGTLEFTKRTKDTTTRVRVYVDRAILEPAKADQGRSANVPLALNRISGILVLVASGGGVTMIGSAAVILWTRIVRHHWPDRVVIFSTTIGLFGITVLSVLAYLILEH